jgi:hypothetical protein
MARCVGAAAMLSEGDRSDLAIQALARSATICDLFDRNGVSRKFIYQQAHKACAALDDVFLSGTPEERAFPVHGHQSRLRQVIVALPLICRSSYRGVIEFLRDLLGHTGQIGHRSRCASVGGATGGRYQRRRRPVGHSRGTVLQGYPFG